LHNRPFGGEGPNVVDPELHQFLDHELRPAPLDQSKPDSETGRRRRNREYVAHRLRFGRPDTRPPPPGSVADRERIAGAEPQDSFEMVSVVVAHARVVNIVDQCVGAVRSVGCRITTGHENADLIFEKIP
jgi:hypothetical protein